MNKKTKKQANKADNKPVKSNKRALTLYITAGALVLAIVLCIILVNVNKEDDEPTVSELASDMIDIVPDTDAVINKLEYTNEYGEFSFTLTEGSWVYDKDISFPISRDYCDAIVSDINNLYGYKEITDKIDDLSVYGLSEPAITLKASYDDGSVLDFVFGDYNDTAGGYYMKHGDRVFIVGQGLYGDCSRDLLSMIRGESIINLDASSIDSVVVDGTEYTDSAMVSAIMYKYQFVTLISVADYKNPENYGFDGTEHTVTLKYTTTNYETLEDGGFNTVQVPREYTFRFTEKDGNEYLIIDKAEGETELIYLSSAAKGILEADAGDADAGEIEPLPEAVDSNATVTAAPESDATVTTVPEADVQ